MADGTPVTRPAGTSPEVYDPYRLPEPPTLAECVRRGLASARQNILPGLILQIFACVLVASYYLSPGMRESLQGFTDWRAEAGFRGAFLTTAFCGAVLPWLYLRATRKGNARPSFANGAFLLVYWGFRGMDVELFYRIQAAIWGTGNDVATIAFKVATDQFVYCTLWAVPITAIAYLYLESGFDRKTVARDFGRGWYRRRVLPMLIANLGVWIPTCSLIFALPQPLQLPLFNIVLCFFTLLLAHLKKG
jgi:hypothetical protein